jgi:hypothetical protein
MSLRLPSSASSLSASSAIEDPERSPSKESSKDLGVVKGKKSFDEFIKGMIKIFTAFDLNDDKTNVVELNKFSGIFNAPKIDESYIDNIKKDNKKSRSENPEGVDDESQILTPIRSGIRSRDADADAAPPEVGEGRVRSGFGRFKSMMSRRSDDVSDGGGKRRRSIKRKHRSIRDNNLGSKK